MSVILEDPEPFSFLPSFFLSSFLPFFLSFLVVLGSNLGSCACRAGGGTTELEGTLSSVEVARGEVRTGNTRNSS